MKSMVERYIFSFVDCKIYLLKYVRPPPYIYILHPMSSKYSNQAMRDRLGQALKDKNVSMRSASLAAGQGESYLAGIITNGRDPQLSRLIAVCEYLGVSLQWVLYGFDLPPGSDEIFQLLADKPERAENLAALLRAPNDATE